MVENTVEIQIQETVVPSFIKTPADEKIWQEAKQAANKTSSESEGDSYWKIVNSIYQKMSKALEIMGQFEKAQDDEYDQQEDFLDDNESDPYFSQDENEQPIEFDNQDEADGETTQPMSSEKPAAPSRFKQPTKEEIMGLRNYTMPWEHRAREARKVKADPSKNPHLFQQGKIIEARNAAHADKKAAYQKFVNSPEYKNADFVDQMKMDDQFEANWKRDNPDHLIDAMNQHHNAHMGALSAKDAHGKAKEAQIQAIMGGGDQHPEAVSMQEGLQHVGGIQGEEGIQGTIKQDPAAAFAMGNQEFIKDFANKRKQKAKQATSMKDLQDFDEGAKKDLNEILGPGPAKDRKFEEFFAHYYPLIGMNAKRTIAKLGLDPRHPDIDHGLLHEAGMHGLIQAVNDYDHDHPSKASFATHASNKIRGLQLTAMREQDAIPQEVRAAQKKFMREQKGQKPQAQTAPQVQTPKPQPAPAPQPQAHKIIESSGHPESTAMTDRLKRVGAAKTAVVRRSGTAAQPKKITQAFSVPEFDSDEEEQ